jgi:hypothetical protein
MRRTVRTLALLFVCGTAVLSQKPLRAMASPQPICNCKLHCGDGSWYQISASDGGACQTAFNYYCGGWGNFSYSSTGYSDCLIASPATPI